MGWPRKNERARLYRLPGNDYRLYYAHEGVGPDGQHAQELIGKFKGAVACIRWSKRNKRYGLLWEEVPQTYGGNAKRVSWNELPGGHTRSYFKIALGTTPENFRGLFRMDEKYIEQKELPLR